jgi:Fe-S cluster assembly protein SufD
VALTTAIGESEGVYVSSFAQSEPRLVASGPPWVHQIRKAALESFAELGFPTTHQEDWKFTSVAPIANAPFEPARYELTASLVEKIQHLLLANLGCSRLVFVNGHYCRKLSSPEILPKSVKAGSLAAALADGSGTLEEHLARYADFKTHSFVALNTAFLEDGAYIEIPRGLVLGKPIYLLFVSDPAGRATVSYPHNLVIAGRASQVTIIEGYVGLGEGGYFTNTVTEVVAGEGAVVDYYKLQQENAPSFHVARLQVHQDRSSNVTTHCIALGGTLDREETATVLDGEGAEALLNGLYVITGQQHVDNHTTIDHAKPHCNSRELYKGVLEGKSTGVFNGKIIVRQDAQKTDSKQSNKNLLLSEDAVINTKPQLQIYADDVKCTHAATIGQIDPEAMFYLRSRGLAQQEARNLLTYAFANEMLARIRYEPLRERLSAGLFARLGRGWKAEEA